MAIENAEELNLLVRTALSSCEGYNGTDKRLGLAIGPATNTHFNVFDPETGITYLVSVHCITNRKKE